jgi:hypothetical protein
MPVTVDMATAMAQVGTRTREKPHTEGGFLKEVAFSISGAGLSTP